MHFCCSSCYFSRHTFMSIAADTPKFCFFLIAREHVMESGEEALLFYYYGPMTHQ